MAHGQAKLGMKKGRQQARREQPLRRSARLQKTQQNNQAERLLSSAPAIDPSEPKAPQRVTSPSFRPSLDPQRPIDGFETNRSQDAEDLIHQDQEHRQIPPPSTGNSLKPSTQKGRKKAVSQELWLQKTHNRYPRKHTTSQQTPQRPDPDTYSPVAHWARTSFWPKDLGHHRFEMSATPSKKRKRENKHRSRVLARMATHGIFMQSSKLIKQDSKDLCMGYLKGDRKDVKSSVFTADQFSKVLDRVQNLNEPRVSRDVTPWIVPSAEVLFILGELKLDYIGEELNTVWNRCATMGSGRPKPDYTAGLLTTAFTEEEITKLEHYATPTQPFKVTAEICFPFLMCEAKSGEIGMNESDRQNIHSASIAVQAIFALYQEAFHHTAPHRTQELCGKVLVFTISHDSERVCLYGYFAVSGPDPSKKLNFYRYPIDFFGLTTADSSGRFKGYNFVCNVYEKFASDLIVNGWTPSEGTDEDSGEDSGEDTSDDTDI